MFISKKFIPGLFTVLNAFSGFLSVINSSHGFYNEACLFIFYAALFDTLDGIVARILKSSSKFGVELDSLSDIVSFGVAPSYLIYSVYLQELGAIGIVLSSLVMVFSALRLARFNIELVGFEKDKFIGLPTPVTSITIVSYILFYHNNILNMDVSSKMITTLSVILPLLMISRFKYDSFPNPTWKNIKKNYLKFSLLIVIFIIIILTRGKGLFILCLIYISSGIIRSIVSSVHKKINKKRSKVHNTG